MPKKDKKNYKKIISFLSKKKQKNKYNGADLNNNINYLNNLIKINKKPKQLRHIYDIISIYLSFENFELPANNLDVLTKMNRELIEDFKNEQRRSRYMTIEKRNLKQSIEEILYGIPN